MKILRANNQLLSVSQIFNDNLMELTVNIINQYSLRRKKLAVCDDSKVSDYFLSYKPSFQA